jgi:2-polyprenyl-3-methyl-5-hydroxy-6-metoxy-1,4-benzoquinol methylase
MTASSAISASRGRLRILVALASYGTSNDTYLARIVEEYRAMSFDADIVILSNLRKQIASDIEVLVGLPNRNPWSLPFAHKQLFSDRFERYDLFVYSEDDILITEKNLRALLDVSAALQGDELAGFLRIEKGPNGTVNYPDVHGHFHWDTTSIRSRRQYTLSKFTNEHAACYVLTRHQLRKAIESGGFLVGPHEGRHDLLCSAATDPYTRCGFVKLIPISHFDDFTVHHLPNKYIGKLGVDGPELRGQVDTLLQIAETGCRPRPLFNTETRLWRAAYSKDYYETVDQNVISLIPQNARSVLSIGCGWGATECCLVERGLRVVAVPVDPVICSRAAARGIELVLGDFRTVKAKLGSEKFDCILYLNVLHLLRDPIDVLSLFRDNLSFESVMVIRTPNTLNLSGVWNVFRDPSVYQSLADYDLTGMHFSLISKVRRWCDGSGLRIDRPKGLVGTWDKIIGKLASPSITLALVPRSIASTARRRSSHAARPVELGER